MNTLNLNNRMAMSDGVAQIRSAILEKLRFRATKTVDRYPLSEAQLNVAVDRASEAVIIELEAQILGKRVWEQTSEYKERETSSRPIASEMVPVTWRDAVMDRFVPTRFVKVRALISYRKIDTLLETKVFVKRTEVHFRMCPHLATNDSLYPTEAVHTSWVTMPGEVTNNEAYGIEAYSDEQLREEIRLRRQWQSLAK